MKEGRILIYIITIVAVVYIGLRLRIYYKDYKNNEIVTMIEEYKVKKGKYPRVLSDLHLDLDKKYYYSIDSTDVYCVGYYSGLTDMTRMEYCSNVKSWEESYAGF